MQYFDLGVIYKHLRSSAFRQILEPGVISKHLRSGAFRQILEPGVIWVHRNELLSIHSLEFVLRQRRVASSLQTKSVFFIKTH